MIRMLGIPSGLADLAWPDLVGLLRPSIVRSGGSLSEAALLRGVLARSYQLWAAIDDDDVVAAAITEIRDLPSGLRTVHVLVAGGTLTAIQGCVEGLRDWARDKGAGKLTMDGRLGWRGNLPNWKVSSIMMETDVARR